MISGSQEIKNDINTIEMIYTYILYIRIQIIFQILPSTSKCNGKIKWKNLALQSCQKLNRTFNKFHQLHPYLLQKVTNQSISNLYQLQIQTFLRHNNSTIPGKLKRTKVL